MREPKEAAEFLVAITNLWLVLVRSFQTNVGSWCITIRQKYLNLFGFGGQGNTVLSIDLQTQCASQGTSVRTSSTIDLNNSLERLEARRLGDTSLWTIDISSLFLILYLYSVRGWDGGDFKKRHVITKTQYNDSNPKLVWRRKRYTLGKMTL